MTVSRRSFERVDRLRPRPAWENRYLAVLAASDLLAAAVAGPAAVLVRYRGQADTQINGDGLPYLAVAFAAAAVWPVFLAWGRAYDRRVVGSGGEELRRVGNSAVRFMAGLALVAFAAQAEVARSLLLFGVPAMGLLTIVFRVAVRSRLHRARRAGRMQHRAVLVGTQAEVAAVAARLTGCPEAGLAVAGACLPAGHRPPDGVLLLGPVQQAAVAAAACGADTVLAAGPTALGPDGTRRLGWALEGTGIGLLVAPSLTEVVGNRLTIRPVQDMVLVHVAAPTLSGPKRAAKEAFDRFGALLLVLAASPLLALAAVAVKATSPGPVLFRQRRVGRDGEEFVCLKFRSMYVDAESRLAGLAGSNQADGLLFKIRQDPRVTPVGRVLRRFSVDELPQLLNVFVGQMSLVGPRPPLPGEVARYEEEVHRRLLVKPGRTGLWQVSGRADLPWDRAVQLDLHYVANWSPTLDLVILLRTARAVLLGRGAY